MNDWLSTSEAAAALRCSPRTVRRRCERGEIGARFVSGVWEVDAAAIGHADKSADSRTRPSGQTAKQSDTDLNVSADSRTDSAANGSRTDGHADTEARSIGQTNDRHEMEVELRAQLAREREFSAILKSQLEAVTQSEAQTKAALREALRAMPKQLEAGTPEPPEAAPIAQANNVPSETPDGPQGPEKRDGAALTIADICDELDRRLNP